MTGFQVQQKFNNDGAKIYFPSSCLAQIENTALIKNMILYLTAFYLFGIVKYSTILFPFYILLVFFVTMR